MSDTPNSDESILIELRGTRGVIDISRGNEQDLAEKSARAFNNAMETIQAVARRTAATVRSLNLTEQPDNIELTFGLKLTSEANALIVNAGVEAQINVKLAWKNDNEKPVATEKMTAEAS